MVTSLHVVATYKKEDQHSIKETVLPFSILLLLRAQFIADSSIKWQTNQRGQKLSAFAVCPTTRWHESLAPFTSISVITRRFTKVSLKYLNINLGDKWLHRSHHRGPIMNWPHIHWVPRIMIYWYQFRCAMNAVDQVMSPWWVLDGVKKFN